LNNIKKSLFDDINTEATKEKENNLSQEEELKNECKRLKDEIVSLEEELKNLTDKITQISADYAELQQQKKKV